MARFNRLISRALPMLAVAALTAIACEPARAEWPERQITLIACFPAGGGTDIAARLINTRLAEVLGKPVIVENRGGAGGSIGTTVVARATPDGYTLLVCSSAFVVNPSLYANVTYDPFKDFIPLMVLGASPNVFTVPIKSEIQSLPELIAKAKANPGRIDFASSGNGSSQHLVGALFATMAGVKLNHVPYKGSSGAMNDLIAGTVKLSFVGMPNALPNIASGRLKALAVTSSKRAADLPNVPTLAEAGVPGFDATIWLALLAPAGTPRDIVMKLNTDVAKALSTPDVRKLMRNAGVDVATSTPEELGALLQSELDRWGKVVKETGATVN
jgi:tripartite-type tricarboxylate transporter receptor subunit TctC